MTSGGTPYGHGYSKSYSTRSSARPDTARLRHLSFDRKPSDDATVPEDVSVVSHSNLGQGYDEQENEEDDDDVFAFVPRTFLVLTKPR